MAKTLNEIIETHCHKGLSAAKIFKVLKGTVSRSGIYKAVKRFRDTGSCLPKVRSTPERSVETKKLIKNIGKIKTKSSKEHLKTCSRGTC